MMQCPKRIFERDCHPAAGPLKRRAWMLQERYLAQRLVAFMLHFISWVCNMASVNEIGEPFRGLRRGQD